MMNVCSIDWAVMNCEGFGYTEDYVPNEKYVQDYFSKFVSREFKSRIFCM
jgi:hypothetical protein